MFQSQRLAKVCNSMAANYWESTQRHYWQFSKDELADLRSALEEEEQNLVQAYPLPQLRHLSIYFNQRKSWIPFYESKKLLIYYPESEINRLGKRLSVRQQAMATAQLYVRRFYSKVEIRRTNPYLVIATALYLACKMEETPQHIRLVVTEARSLWPGNLISTIPTKSIVADLVSGRLLQYGHFEAGGVRILPNIRDEFTDDCSPSLSKLVSFTRHFLPLPGRVILGLVDHKRPLHDGPTLTLSSTCHCNYRHTVGFGTSAHRKWWHAHRGSLRQ